MSLLKNIQAQLANYLNIYPDEAGMVEPLRVQLQNSPNEILLRSTMSGHITASAFILSPDQRSALLIYHKALEQWLQPGGHFEGDLTLQDTASREVVEETGVTKFRLLPLQGELDVPFDIDTHPIPARPSKQEGDHFHHDFTYLAIAASEEIPGIQDTEVENARFVPLCEIAEFENPRLRRLAEKALSMFTHAH